MRTSYEQTPVPTSGAAKRIRAHFYVCGEATRMAKDVDDALIAIIREYGGMSSERAHDYRSELVATKRLVREVN